MSRAVQPPGGTALFIFRFAEAPARLRPRRYSLRFAAGHLRLGRVAARAYGASQRDAPTLEGSLQHWSCPRPLAGL